MPSPIRKCPLCGSILNAGRFALVMQQHRGIERQFAILKSAEAKVKKELARVREQARAARLANNAKAKARIELERLRAADRLKRHQQSSRRLKDQIEDLERRLKHGETAQSEGLLEERALLALLKDHFPSDAYEHVGKGGDILQVVRSDRGVVAGRIVYEVKRVSGWSNGHVTQCAEARVSREADVAILVTNRLPARRQHYFVDRGVLVISPLAVLPLVHTAREGLLNAAALRASGEQRGKAVKAVYQYLAGGQYTDHIRRVSQHLADLEGLFNKEVSSHRRVWNDRLSHYRGIVTGVSSVHDRLRTLVGAASTGTRALPSSAKALLPQFTRVKSE